MSIFDPLGMLAPFVNKSKILLGDIWRSTVEWDEQVDGMVCRTGSDG